MIRPTPRLVSATYGRTCVGGIWPRRATVVGCQKHGRGATLRKAWRAIATLGRQPLIDHDNLEEFADAHDYDLQDPSDTGVAFYTALAQETGGPVLELACGTGRVSIPIARLGFAVTGLDIVPGCWSGRAANPPACPCAGSRATRARSTSASGSG